MICRIRRSTLSINDLSPLQNSLINSELSQRLIEQMLANGWCCHQVNHLSKLHSLEAFSYLASLERSSHRLVDHKQCSNRAICVAYNADLATYETQHVDSDCDCSMISTPYAPLTKVIQDGGLPLVSIEGSIDADMTHRLSVHPRTRKCRYIAVSHVWADGLGNPNENALPLCQIKRLEINLLALAKEFGDSNVSSHPVSLSCRLGNILS